MSESAKTFAKEHRKPAPEKTVSILIMSTMVINIVFEHLSSDDFPRSFQILFSTKISKRLLRFRDKEAQTSDCSQDREDKIKRTPFSLRRKEGKV